MSQVIFCRTIYSNFTIPQDSSEILLIGLSTLEGDLELELSKLVAKERIRQIN